MLDPLQRRMLLAASYTGTNSAETIVLDRNTTTGDYFILLNGTVVQVNSAASVGKAFTISALDGNDTVSITANVLSGVGVTVFGNAGNDTLAGGGNTNDSLEGSAGDDVIYISTGDDELIGGSGNDFVSASFVPSSFRVVWSLDGVDNDQLYNGATLLAT